jgi:hypothetical protein
MVAEKKSIDKMAIFEQYGLIKVLLLYFDHPEGIQKIFYRKEPINLAPSTSIRVHELLFSNNIITNIPHPNKLLFTLTEKGRAISLLLKNISLFLNHYPDSSNEIILTDLDRTTSEKENPINQTISMLKEEWKKVEELLIFENALDRAKIKKKQ